MADSWREWTGRPAFPTMLLTAFVVAGWALVWLGAVQESLSLAQGLALSSLLAYLAFTPLHEATHENISGRSQSCKGLERLCGWLCGYILLAPFPTFRVMHLQHHAHTNDPVYDPDCWVRGNSLLSTVLRCATILPHYYVFFLGKRGGQVGAIRRERLTTCVGLASIALVIGVLCWAGFGWQVLMLWVLPAAIATCLLGLFLDWMPHFPHESRERYHDTRIVLAPGLALLTMAHNYHLIHHLHPRVPFYAYGRVFHLQRDKLEERGAPILDLLARPKAQLRRLIHG